MIFLRTVFILFLSWSLVDARCLACVDSEIFEIQSSLPNVFVPLGWPQCSRRTFAHNIFSIECSVACVSVDWTRGNNTFQMRHCAKGMMDGYVNVSKDIDFLCVDLKNSQGRAKVYTCRGHHCNHHNMANNFIRLCNDTHVAWRRCPAIRLNTNSRRGSCENLSGWGTILIVVVIWSF